MKETYSARVTQTDRKTYLELSIDGKPIGQMPLKYLTNSHDVLAYLTSLNLPVEQKQRLGPVAIRELTRTKEAMTRRLLENLGLEGKLGK